MGLSKYRNVTYLSRLLIKAISVGCGLILIKYFPLNYFLYDISTLVKAHIQPVEESKVLIVEIDDQSLQTLNQYPLARHYYITALRNINNSSLILIDILFTGYSPYDLVIAELAQDKSNLIIATTLLDEKLPLFYESAAAVGHAFIPYGSNKIVREFPIEDSLQSIVTYLYQLIGYGPTTRDYDFLIWPRKKDFTIISFRELLIQPIDAKGKVVLIGYTSTATDDVVRIPLRGTIPGVYAHASYIHNSINGTGLYLINFPLPIYIFIAFAIQFIPKRYSLSIGLLGPFTIILFSSYYIQIELLFLSSISHLIARTIANIVKKSKFLEGVAFTDALTGLLNRRALDVKAQEVWSISPYLSVFMTDIDFFKKYNDRYGHPQGDVALRAVAQALRKSVRDKDIVARYGGEEFTIIIFSLNKPPRERIEVICRNINTAITDLKLEHEDSSYKIITLSIGAITVKSNEYSYEQALDLADKELYKSKLGSRNTYHYSEI